VAVFGLPYPVVQAAGQSMVATINADCSQCKASYTEFQLSDVGTPAVTTRIVSLLQSNPKIKYLGVGIAPLAQGVSEALAAAGITGVKIVGLSPDDTTLKYLQGGSASMMIANTAEIGAWALFDAALRVLDSGKPWDGHTYPIAIVTPANVSKTATHVGQITYPTDFRAEFKKLWQVG
jgi:ABC-type sugar transport system substrate-binding protein